MKRNLQSVNRDTFKSRREVFVKEFFSREIDGLRPPPQQNTELDDYVRVTSMQRGQAGGGKGLRPASHSAGRGNRPTQTIASAPGRDLEWRCGRRQGKRPADSSRPGGLFVQPGVTRLFSEESVGLSGHENVFIKICTYSIPRRITRIAILSFYFNKMCLCSRVVAGARKGRNQDREIQNQASENLPKPCK